MRRAEMLGRAVEYRPAARATVGSVITSNDKSIEEVSAKPSLVDLR